MDSNDHKTVIPIRSPNNYKICEVLLKDSERLIIIKSHGKNDIFPINYLIDILLDIRDGAAKNDPTDPDGTPEKKNITE